MKFIWLVAFQLFIYYSTQSNDWLDELLRSGENSLFEETCTDLFAAEEDPYEAHPNLSDAWENSLGHDSTLEPLPCEELPSTTTLVPAPALQASNDADQPKSPSEPVQASSDTDKRGCSYLDQPIYNAKELKKSLNDHQKLPSHTIEHKGVMETASRGSDSLPSAEVRVVACVPEKLSRYKSLFVAKACPFSSRMHLHMAKELTTEPLPDCQQPTTVMANESTTEPFPACQQPTNIESVSHIQPAPPNEPTIVQSVSHVQPVSPSELTEQVLWFPNKSGNYYSSQAATGKTTLSVLFSERCAYGVFTIQKYKNYMAKYLTNISYRIDPTKIMFMDGFAQGVVDWTRFKTVVVDELNERSLKVEEFRKLYPLKDNGLVISLCSTFKLVMASYGKPQLGAIILRSDGTHLFPIARSSDNLVIPVTVQNGDLAVVGPFKIISKLQSGDLKLVAGDLIKETTEKVARSVPYMPFCVVATISIKQQS